MDYEVSTSIDVENHFETINHISFDYKAALSEKGEMKETIKVKQEYAGETHRFLGSILTSDFQKYKKLYQTLVSNLFKTKDFLELTIENMSEQITDDEFEKEIMDHPHKFIKEISEEKPTLSEIRMIVDILKDLGKEKELSVDDVSELFSVDLSTFDKILEGVGNHSKITTK